MTKRIGILTSGGDCAGLNATIRAVALRAHHGYGWTTVGIRYGTLGLLERPVEAVTLDPDRLDAALARQGGTFLGSTNRGDPFAFPMEDRSLKDRSGEMVEGLASLRLDGLIGVGGDGSLDILRRLMAQARHRLHRHSQDHRQRCRQYRARRRLLDGGRHRHRGARSPAADRRQPRAGHGAGGDGPRRGPYRHRRGHRRRRRCRADPRGAAGVSSAWSSTSRACARPAALGAGRGGGSGAAFRRDAAPPMRAAMHGIGDWLAHRLSQETGAETRATVLGHVQRGAMPTAEDRLLASALGVRAVDLSGRRQGRPHGGVVEPPVIDVPLEKVVGRSRTVDRDGTPDPHRPRAGHLPRRRRLASAVFRSRGSSPDPMSNVVAMLSASPRAKPSRPPQSPRRSRRDPEHLALALLGVEPQERQPRKRPRAAAAAADLAQQRAVLREVPRRFDRMRRTRSSPSSPAANARRGS